MSVKQIITGHIANEQDLPLEFNDNVAPSDRVYRTTTGYVVVTADDDQSIDGEALGSVDEMA
jgi:hypothetical protein